MVVTKQDFKFEKNPFYEQWSYGLCTLDLYVRARAHWPNVTQTDLNVVVVIIGVLLQKMLMCCGNRRFLK